MRCLQLCKFSLTKRRIYPLTVHTEEIPPNLSPSFVWGVLVQPIVTETRAPDAKLENEVCAGFVCLCRGGDGEEAGISDVDKIERLVEGLGPGKVILEVQLR